MRSVVSIRRAGYAYDGPSYRYPDRLSIFSLDKDTTGHRIDIQSVVSLSRPSYRYPGRLMDMTGRRIDIRVDLWIRRAVVSVSRPSYRYPAWIRIRRAVVSISGPAMDTTGRRIHIQGVVSIRRAVQGLTISPPPSPPRSPAP